MSSRTLVDDLGAAAVQAPTAQAVVTPSGSLSYAELDRLAAGVAGGLASLGVQRGDRVALLLPNGLEAAAAIYGVLRAGAALSPLNPQTRAERLRAVVEDCRPRALLCDAEHRELADEAAAGCDTEVRELAELAGDARAPQAPLSVDLGCVIYTSGSTGEPKGVTHSHANMAFVAGAIVESLGMRSSDRVLCVLQLSFGYGLYQLFTCVRARATLVLEPGFAFAGRLVGLLEEQRITILPGVPTVFGVMLSLRGLADRDLPDLRLLTSAGAALPLAMAESLRAAIPGADVCPMYGQTEAQRICFLPPGQFQRRPGSVGIPIPGTEAWIEDEAGNRLGPGEAGELIVRGAHVMQGYWEDDELTARKLRAGRWPWERELVTGDLFRLDDDGYLYFLSRRDDVFKSRGEKVVPLEIEEVLHTAPGVRVAAVVAVPDELLGNVVHAHVAADPGHPLDEAELRRHCAERLETHKVPKRVFVHDDLPRIGSGKIDRRALAPPDPDDDPQGPS